MPGLLNSFTFAAPAAPTGYNGVVEALSPIGRWKLDETSGTSAAAAHGSAGTYVGTPTLGGAGLISDGGKAVTVDGNTQEITIPLSGLGTSGSLLFTYATTDTGADIIFRDNTSAGGTGWFMNITGGTAALTTRVNGTSRTNTGTNSNTIRDGSPHMFVLTTDGSTVTLYIDGVQADQWAQAGAFSTLVTPLHFGRNGTSTGTANFWPGTYDDIAVFSSVLSSTDAAALWAAR